MKLFWQKAEVQKFEHAKDFAEEYNIGKNDFILASKSTYETYFAPLGMKTGLLAILIGHVIGCILLFLAGYLGAKTSLQM